MQMRRQAHPRIELNCIAWVKKLTNLIEFSSVLHTQWHTKIFKPYALDFAERISRTAISWDPNSGLPSKQWMKPHDFCISSARFQLSVISIAGILSGPIRAHIVVALMNVLHEFRNCAVCQKQRQEQKQKRDADCFNVAAKRLNNRGSIYWWMAFE